MSEKKKRMTKKYYRLLTLTLSVVLVGCGIIGGTIAWLVAESKTVTNTFTYGDIDLILDETETDEKGNPVDDDGNTTDEDGNPIAPEDAVRTTENEYAMVPGETYFKDPVVTVVKKSEKSWLFVKVEEDGGVTITKEDGTTEVLYDFDYYLTYDIADIWTPLFDADGNAMEGVYYLVVDRNSEADAMFYVLKDNEISVNENVTKEALNALDANGSYYSDDYPKLLITAYAVQYSGFMPLVSEGATEEEIQEATQAAALKAWNHIWEPEDSGEVGDSTENGDNTESTTP